MPDVVVVGGGIIGASVAYRLTCAGARVTLLESGQPGGGTSASTFAWINANAKPPLGYHRLNAAGVAEHHALRRELGAAPWLHTHGNLEWVGDGDADARLDDKLARLHDWGYPAQLLEPAEAVRLEPDLAIPGHVARVAYYPFEGYVDVPVLIGHLLDRARAAGARIVTRARVIRMVRQGQRIAGVVTADGRSWTADTVVGCTGPWTDELARLAGARVPLACTAGLLALCGPAPTRLRSVVHTPGVYLRPAGGGRVLAAANDLDATVSADTPVVPAPAACAEILRRAGAVLPGLDGAAVEAARVGVRPIPADGYPAVGPVPDADGLYVVCTHSGVTLGPLLGRIVAAELLGRVDARLGAFRPERLLAGSASGGL